MGITDPEVLLINALDLYHDLHVELTRNPDSEICIHDKVTNVSHSFKSFYPTLSIKMEYSDE